MQLSSKTQIDTQPDAQVDTQPDTQVDTQPESSSMMNIDSVKIKYLVEPKGEKFDKAKRIIAIVYDYYPNIDNVLQIYYGACIFRKESKKDTCIKSQIRNTAWERFMTNPVKFTLDNILITDNKIFHDTIVKQIRYKMYVCGVKGKNVLDHIDLNLNNVQMKKIKKKIELIIEDSDSDDQPDTKLEDQPDTKLEDQPDTKLEDQPKTELEDQPETKLEDQPKTESEEIPESELECQSESELEEQPESELEDPEESNKLIDLKSFRVSDPIISYILEPKNSSWTNAKRIIAIAYTYTTNEISYGACIFKRDFSNEICKKANIRTTALERFYNNPINLEKNNLDDTQISLPDILNIIRKKMYVIGVKY